MKSEDNIINYALKSATDWVFKRSPVTYFIGSVLAIAAVAVSGNLILDASNNAVKLTYGNNLTSFALTLAAICCFLAYGALRLQMRERYTKIIYENESKHLENQEKLKAQLELVKRKAQNSHCNLGIASNALLRKLVKLEDTFAVYIGNGVISPEYIENKRADVYISDAIYEQHKFRSLYADDKKLRDSWNKMLSYLDASQKTITGSINGEKLDTLPLSQSLMFISEYMKQISDSGHAVEIELYKPA
jgi:hypothetical protein